MTTKLRRPNFKEMLLSACLLLPGFVLAQQPEADKAADAPVQEKEFSLSGLFSSIGVSGSTTEAAQTSETPTTGAAAAAATTTETPAQETKFSFSGLLSNIGISGSNSEAAPTTEASESQPVKKTTVKEERPTDLLTGLERGEKLRRAKSLEASRDTWLAADEYVRAWEDEAKNSPEKLLQSVGEGLGSVLINDTVRRYDGADYERVALATKLSLAHLALGDWDKARTEIRKMHEREAIIAEFRSKEVESLKSEQEEKKLSQTEIKDLKGYPVEALDIPEVVNLRNSYQSALGHYLAGFIYEQSGEGSLAAAGYRQAIELRPDIPALQNALAGLDRRVGKAKPNLTDTLVVIEAGNIPLKKSTTIPLPVPTHNGLVIVPTSFPSMPDPVANPVPTTITVDGKSVDVATVTSYDSMARREMKDAMPGVIVRGTIRALAKGVINSEMQKRAGLFGSLLSTVLTTATEKADTRMWSSLPSHVGLARIALAPGKHVIEVGGKPNEIEVNGAYSLVAMRHDANEPFINVATTPRVEAPTMLAKADEAAVKSTSKAAGKKGAAKKSAAKEKAK